MLYNLKLNKIKCCEMANLDAKLDDSEVADNNVVMSEKELEYDRCRNI